jgi:hypothetical protein
MEGMPNAYRDPEDPREKLKRYLKDRMGADEQLMGDQDYRRMTMAPQQTLMDSNSNIGLAQALNRSAAQIGTIGGRTADTRPATDYGDQLKEQNMSAMKGIGQQRAEMADMDDRQLKIKQYLAEKMQGGEDKARDRDLMSKKLDAQLSQQKLSNDLARQRMDQGERSLRLKESKPGLSLTPGQEAADKKYGGTNYIEWTGGGQAQYRNNKDLLSDALGKVEGLRDFWLNPRVDALLPDVVRPEVTKVVQQDVSKAAIGAARAALGSQFTAQEHFWVQRLSYDPGLSAEENIQKIKRNLAEIEAIAADNDAMAAEFEDRGTISGYKSKRVQKKEDVGDDLESMSLEDLEALNNSLGE